MKTIRILTFFLASTVAVPALAACSLPNYQLPPNDATAATFALAMDYPTNTANADRFSTETDFRTDWETYLGEVLAYAFEGNLENWTCRGLMPLL